MADRFAEKTLRVGGKDRAVAMKAGESLFI